MTAVDFIVPCRDKARHVAACVYSVLAQTYSPMTIWLSDQGSTDGTREILADLVAEYNGPNDVRLVDCPNTKYRGMPGLNAHLNWLHKQLTGDLVIMCSADDLNHPERVAHTVAAFEAHNPSYVCTGVEVREAIGTLASPTTFPNKCSRMIGIAEAIIHQIGSNGSSAWARELYTRHGPLLGYEQQDMILPMMALMERGIYYVDLPLHTYIKHADLANTGFQGQIAATETMEHRAKLVEMSNFVHVRNWTRVFERWMSMGAIKDESLPPLFDKIRNCAYAWAYSREALILGGVPHL